MPPRKRPATFLITAGARAQGAGFLGQLEQRFAVRMVQCRGAGPTRLHVLSNELLMTVQLLFSRRLFRSGTIVISGANPIAALAASRVHRALGRKHELFVFNFYLHQLGENALVRRVLAFLLTKHVLIAAQSQVDVDYFRALSGDVRLALVPYGQGPVPGVTDEDVCLGDYVFSGGHTNRDYNRLLRCAGRLAAIPFVIACSSLSALTEPIPDNVVVHRDLYGEPFHRLLAGARLVVVPLADDVGSAGQMVTLAAMQLGKAVLVADSPVVTQYVEDGVTGAVYDRTSDTSLITSIAKLVDDEAQLVSLGSSARSAYELRHTKTGYEQGLLAALDAMVPAAFDRASPGTDAGDRRSARVGHPPARE